MRGVLQVGVLGIGFVVLGVVATSVGAQEKQTPEKQAAPVVSEQVVRQLGEQLDPWLAALQLRTGEYRIKGGGTIPIDNKAQEVGLEFVRHSDDAFELVLEHPEYALTCVRTKDFTAVVLPKHRKVFWGVGDVDEEDHLGTKDFLKRSIKGTSEWSTSLEFVKLLDGGTLSQVLLSAGSLRSAGLSAGGLGEGERGSEGKLRKEDRSEWVIDGKIRVGMEAGSVARVEVRSEDIQVRLELGVRGEGLYLKEMLGSGMSPQAWLVKYWGDYEQEEIERREIERTVSRGVRRAAEVLAPSYRLTNPVMKNRKVANGELRWVEGHRVVLLTGTPEEIGKAHGELLKTESMRCIDSVLYGFGFAQTIATGRWFRKDLDRAYGQLKPYIPERHLVETRAMARVLQLDEHLVETINVFPELFHCSGFAVFGDATVDGKLYHGRVLDYMTAIGLQDAATTFVVAPKGYLPFVNIGYAGFTGSVSGMNAAKISLGEMGGRGEGQWDGVPMATLMRRAMEECDTLEEVKKLWSDSPRTCEYYYVFADGETKRAVGVAATPQKIEFVAPGEAHALLGDGIENAVVLSAGSRLDELKRRVKANYGKIDTQVATELMCRPVAMNSNLHNVLFVPEDGLLYVANANHKEVAADRPYVRLDLFGLLREMSVEIPQRERLGGNVGGAAGIGGAGDVGRAGEVGRVFEARDSLRLAIEEELSADAKECLDGLCWENGRFDVRIDAPDEKQRGSGIDRIVRFASPMPSGDPINDLVAVEWYQATRRGKKLDQAPGIVVVHESGRGMTVGKMIARGLSNQGVHAFLMQLPTYGMRRNPASTKSEGESLISGLKQGIADARRAYDAVRVLPGVDPQRVSIQGTSLGGFVVATTTGLDSVYHRSVIFLAGGDLYGVLANGDRDAEKTRRELTKSGISMERAKEALYTIEPMRLAHRVSPERTWVYSGTKDTVVPPANSKLYVQGAKLPQEHHVELPADHYSGIVFLPSIIQEIARLASEPVEVGNTDAGKADSVNTDGKAK
jgi:hypothetical protein